jgi:hypothetical protein
MVLQTEMTHTNVAPLPPPPISFYIVKPGCAISPIRATTCSNMYCTAKIQYIISSIVDFIYRSVPLCTEQFLVVF